MSKEWIPIWRAYDEDKDGINYFISDKREKITYNKLPNQHTWVLFLLDNYIMKRDFGNTENQCHCMAGYVRYRGDKKTYPVFVIPGGYREDNGIFFERGYDGERCNLPWIHSPVIAYCHCIRGFPGPKSLFDTDIKHRMPTASDDEIDELRKHHRPTDERLEKFMDKACSKKWDKYE